MAREEKLKAPIDLLVRPVSRFIQQEFTGGLVLFAGVLIAVVSMNTPLSDGYSAFWENILLVGFGDYRLEYPLHVWINDGLMAIFFFVIGLELKREFLAGELSTFRKAALPMGAALGGMLVPAGIYALFNLGSAGAKGWGIPMATDIAFAIAILSLAGKHIPNSIKVFLSALAVADDLGAILVIAFFYGHEIRFIPLLSAGGFLLLLATGNYLGIRKTIFYLVLGVAVWICILLSGIHATIAGVLVALTIPARTRVNELEYSNALKKLFSEFEKERPTNHSLTTPRQNETLQTIKKVSTDAETPLQKIEYRLHPWVAFGVMPLFALANAGMVIGPGFFSSLLNPVSLGIMTGLTVGKFAGVFSFTWLMVKCRFAALPVASTWKHIAGVALLAGVGFTMSLFITGLAFNDLGVVNQAKSGIVMATLTAGIAGVLVLRKLPARP